LAEETEAQLRGTLEHLADEGLTTADLLFTELPLTARVVRSDDTAAQIEVWSVAIVGAPVPDTVPNQGWRTVTVDLGWVEGDWLVTGWAARPGPVPAPRPAATFDVLEDLEDVTSWPSAAGRAG
jgi:subtilisin family serine protease